VEINLNKILKDKGNEDIEADLIRNSNRSGIKRKNKENIYKRRVKSNISSGGLEDKGLNVKKNNKWKQREKNKKKKIS
jgi:hypothetical protein